MWQVVPELSTVETATRFQGLFLVVAAVCGLAAFCRRGESASLNVLVGTCAGCAFVAFCLTAVLFAYKVLLLLQLLDRPGAFLISHNRKNIFRETNIPRGFVERGWALQSGATSNFGKGKLYTMPESFYFLYESILYLMSLA